MSDSLEAIVRIVAMVRGLSRFTRIDEDDVGRVDINEVVQVACGPLRHQIRRNRSVSSNLRAAHRFPGERGKLVQVVVNLLMNASQDGRGGRSNDYRRHSEHRGRGGAASGRRAPASRGSSLRGFSSPSSQQKAWSAGPGWGSPCAPTSLTSMGYALLASLGRPRGVFRDFVPFATGRKVAEQPPWRQGGARGGRIMVWTTR